MAQACRFSDCAHRSEPGCAIKEAIAAGTLDVDRYESFEKLRREQRHLAARVDPRERAEERKRYKALAKLARQSPKAVTPATCDRSSRLARSCRRLVPTRFNRVFSSSSSSFTASVLHLELEPGAAGGPPPRFLPRGGSSRGCSPSAGQARRTWRARRPSWVLRRGVGDREPGGVGEGLETSRERGRSSPEWPGPCVVARTPTRIPLGRSKRRPCPEKKLGAIVTAPDRRHPFDQSRQESPTGARSRPRRGPSHFAAPLEAALVALGCGLDEAPALCLSRSSSTSVHRSPSSWT